MVFRSPRDVSTYFIKRIIGLPGERIKIKNDRIEIVVSDKKEEFFLEESYLSPGAANGGVSEYSLGQNEYFVLGDNRSFSFDSRSWGSLPAEDIVGLVRLRLWPLDNLSAFAAPQY